MSSTRRMARSVAFGAIVIDWRHEPTDPRQSARTARQGAPPAAVRHHRPARPYACGPARDRPGAAEARVDQGSRVQRRARSARSNAGTGMRGHGMRGRPASGKGAGALATQSRTEEARAAPGEGRVQARAGCQAAQGRAHRPARSRRSGARAPTRHDSGRLACRQGDSRRRAFCGPGGRIQGSAKDRSRRDRHREHGAWRRGNVAPEDPRARRGCAGIRGRLRSRSRRPRNGASRPTRRRPRRSRSVPNPIPARPGPRSRRRAAPNRPHRGAAARPRSRDTRFASPDGDPAPARRDRDRVDDPAVIAVGIPAGRHQARRTGHIAGDAGGDPVRHRLRARDGMGTRARHRARAARRHACSGRARRAAVRRRIRADLRRPRPYDGGAHGRVHLPGARADRAGPRLVRSRRAIAGSAMGRRRARVRRNRRRVRRRVRSRTVDVAR